MEGFDRGTRVDNQGMNATSDSTAAIRRLRLAIGAVIVLAAVEIATGIASGSLALLSDAGHLVTDSATLGLAWFALARARRPAGASHTYGHHRNGILVAAVNGLVLLGIAAVIAVTAVGRLQHPAAVTSAPVIAVAAVALVVNVFLATRLNSANGGLSVRSAALHVAADALADAAVVAGGVVIAVTGFSRADAIASLVIAALVAAAAVRIVREAVHILNEATPRGLDLDAVRLRLAAMPGIEDVHDLHVWSLDSQHRAMSVHVLIADRPLAEVTAMIRDVERIVCDDFGIEHATVQPECPSCVGDPALYCDLDTHHDLAHAGPRPV